MYHLFASQGFGADHDGATLFDPSTFVGHLYRASDGDANNTRRSISFHMSYASVAFETFAITNGPSRHL